MSQLNIFAALEELASNPKNLGFLPAPEDFADTQEFTQAEVDEYFFDFPFTPEGAVFHWPEGGLAEEKLLARIDKLKLVVSRHKNPETRKDVQLCIDVLEKFQAQRSLDVVDDICKPIEASFGIGEVDSLKVLDNSDDEDSSFQQRLDRCYSVVGKTCRILMKDLGYTTYKNASSWLVNKPSKDEEYTVD